MNWLLFLFVLEVGFLPQGDFIMYDKLELVPVRYSMHTDLQAEVEIGGMLFVGGGVKTGIWYYDGYTFWPHRSTYSFRAGLRWRGLEAGWRHYCFHPVTPYFHFLKYKAIWEGSYDEIYLRLERKQ